MSPDKLLIEMTCVLEQGNYLLLTTKLSQEGNPVHVHAEESNVIVDLQKSILYSINSASLIESAVNIKTDSLEKSHEKTFVKSFQCDVYQVKGNPAIKIYASKDIPDYVNPGIKTFPNSIGGIIKMEIVTNCKQLVYYFIHQESTNQKFTKFLDLVKKSKLKPVGFKSILGI
ncbi:MAG: hypothetical protein R2850_03425 [Bacteroidia bacterium]